MSIPMMPIETERKALRGTQPQMVIADENLLSWQAEARKKLSELLGMSRFTSCDAAVTVEYVTETPEYTETRFTFQSEPDCVVPCHFLAPRGAGAKPPVMICLQGHSTGMHISLNRPKFPGDAEDADDGDRDYALQAVKHGLCAVTLEQRCFGERGGRPKPDCYLTAMTALLSGRTLLGGRVWDIMRLVDVLEACFADVCDISRVYCCGNSGGGTATIYAAALETRIAAAMPSCAFCTYRDSIGAMYHCACNYVPGINLYFDMAELAGMVAPRPLVIVNGKDDDIFPLPGAKHEFERARDLYYARSAAPGNIAHVVGPEGHRFYADPAWPVFFGLTK